MRTPVFIVLYLAFLLVPIGSFVASGEEPWAVLLLMLAPLGSAIVFLVALYKGWKAIKDSYTKVSPGQAVGLMFIPLFNFYWMFRAVGGFPKEYRAYLARSGIGSDSISKGWFYAYPIMVILNLFLFQSEELVAALIGYLGVCVIGSFVIGNIGRAINALNKPQPESQSIE